MNKLRIAMAFLVLIFLAGCVPFAARVKVTECAIVSQRMNQLVKEGKTTREEEQEFIDLNAQIWDDFDKMLNRKKANEEPSE